MTARSSDRLAGRLVGTSLAASVLLATVLTAAYVAYASKLALAQAADSLSDVLTGGALLWALRVSLQPPDEDHPFGHQGAQPVAALVVAVLVGVLAVEVVVEAAQTLLAGSRVLLAWPLAVALGAKVVVKLVLLLLARPRGREGSVLRAFRVDARNDVLLGVTSIAGFFAARYLELKALDAWLAIPIGIWIFVSGMMLGLENMRYLMGSAPPKDRQNELASIAGTVTGVSRVESLKARFHGSDIHVWIEIRVDAGLPIAEAHDVGEAVEHRILQEPDVCDVVVHVDADRRA